MTIEEYQRLSSGRVNTADMLGMPGAADIDFEPPRLQGAMWRPSDLSDINC